MEPLRAASREKGTLAPPRPNDEGSGRWMRRRERIPTRFEARVGERPAGAVSGEGATVLVFNRAAWDLGWRIVRGRADAKLLLGGALRISWTAGEGAAALARAKAAGFVKLLWKSFQRSGPFGRFEKSTGAIFSELSESSTSEAFRLTGEVEMAWACQLAVTRTEGTAEERGLGGEDQAGSGWHFTED